MRTGGRFAFLLVAILLSHAKPSHAHMTKECLFSIIKLNLSIDAFRRFNTSSAIGQIMGASPEDVAATEALGTLPWRGRMQNSGTWSCAAHQVTPDPCRVGTERWTLTMTPMVRSSCRWKNLFCMTKSLPF